MEASSQGPKNKIILVDPEPLHQLLMPPLSPYFESFLSTCNWEHIYFVYLIGVWVCKTQCPSIKYLNPIFIREKDSKVYRLPSSIILTAEHTIWHILRAQRQHKTLPMPQVLAPYSPYNGLGGLVKALSTAAGFNIDLDKTNSDKNQGLLAERPSIPKNELQVLATCTRHPGCPRGLGHSGRCKTKAVIKTKNILPDATGHRQCPYENDCVNEAGHRGRCKIRPRPAATSETPAQPSPTPVATTRPQEEEEEDAQDDSGTTVVMCRRNPCCLRVAGHVGRCNNSAPKKSRAGEKKKQAAVEGSPLPPRKRRPGIDLTQYMSSEIKEEDEKSDDEVVESVSGSEIEDEEEEQQEQEWQKINDKAAVEHEKDIEEIQIPKWPARKRARGRLSGVHSDRKDTSKASPVKRSGSGSASGRRGARGGRGSRGGGRGGRPSSAAPLINSLLARNVARDPTPAVPAAAPVPRVLQPTPPAATGVGGNSLVQQCRAVEAALERCGVSAHDRLSYSMKFSVLPAEVREAQWDALQRHIDGGNEEAVVAAVAMQARSGARY
jgi:hypothetical protein